MRGKKLGSTGLDSVAFLHTKTNLFSCSVESNRYSKSVEQPKPWPVQTERAIRSRIGRFNTCIKRALIREFSILLRKRMRFTQV